MDHFVVYMHTVPNGKKYIGITGQLPEKRWHNGMGYKENTSFWKDIIKYGWNNIKHEILSTNLSEDEARHLEADLIMQHKCNDPNFGYNVVINKCDSIKKEVKRLPTNTNLLKAKMVEQGDTDCVNCLMKLLNVSRTTASTKLNGHAPFNQNEMTLITEKYNLSASDFVEIFLGGNRIDSLRMC